MFGRSVAALAALMVAAAVGAALPGSARPGSSGASVDVELAFDTTGSMRPALARARRDAEEILAGVRAVVPGARFAVVAFRDRGNPGGEYQTLQPLTNNSAAIRAALAKLKAVHNTNPGNLNVESYNLAFHRSFTESGLKWAADSRKIMVVMGDAEGYGGGTAGLPGCLDTHADSDGLEIRRELLGMRAAQRTLVMIRQVSSYTTASLDCYASMAALTYPGGAARDGNSSDVVTPLLALVQGAVAPIAITATAPAVLPGGRDSFVVSVTNPNGFAVQANDLTISLPADMSGVNASPAPTTTSLTALSWTLGKTLAPHSTLVFRLSGRVGAKPRVDPISAVGHFQVATEGAPFASEASTQIHVTRSVGIELNSLVRRGSIRGKSVLSLAKARSLRSSSGTKLTGSFRLLGTSSHSLTLKPTAYHLALAKGHAVVRLNVRVAAVSRAAGCRVGTRGTLTVTDWSYGTAAGQANARVVLPAACRPSGASWPATAGAIRPLP